MRSLPALLAACLPLLPWVVAAAEPEVHVAISGNRFVPAELVVQAGQKLRLIIENKDGTPEEFESYTLNREKVVSSGGTVVVFVGPLKPGRYEFFGDFHPETARGWLVAQP